MSTQTKERTQTQAATNGTHPAPVTLNAVQAAKEIEYLPLGAGDNIKLSVAIIRLILNPRTKSGRQAPDDQILKFMMLCRARKLDPFENDAYLIGYEGQDGDQWSLITSIYAFLKRAEMCPQYEGMESGVIVKTADGAIEEHIGDFLTDDEVILGGWCKVHRNDRKYPNHKRVEFKRYSTTKSRWKDDPGGMIVKVAECQALRDTFPTTLGGMFVLEEMGERETVTLPPPQPASLPMQRGKLTASKPALEPQPKQVSPETETVDDSGEIHEEPTGETHDNEAAKTGYAERLDKAKLQIIAEVQRTKMSGDAVTAMLKTAGAKRMADLTLDQAENVLATIQNYPDAEQDAPRKLDHDASIALIRSECKDTKTKEADVCGRSNVTAISRLSDLQIEDTLAWLAMKPGSKQTKPE